MRLIDWLDNRTGARKLAERLLNEPIPGGARWRYVWGSVLVFLFCMQVLTGVLLMTGYSPSATTAWGSVWYIQTQVTLGWLIRGLHHFGSQAMIILLPLHVFQVVLARAYRAPRELNFWTGLLLAGVVAALALTGYLLPWDQKGYWATAVATNIIALIPVVGERLQAVLIGGSEYGNATLTRFFTLHVMLLPGSLAVLMIGHLALFRRHGLTVTPKVTTAHPTADGNFWPDQLLRDSVACAAVLGILLAVVVTTRHVLDAPLLDAPADPASPNYPARPEWYFLFLFQLLKYFEGSVWELVGAIAVPGGVLAVFFALPFLDRWLPPRHAHRLAVGWTIFVFGGACCLTGVAWYDDRDPRAAVVEAVQAKQRRGEPLSEVDRGVLRARRFNHRRKLATRFARRAIALADERGIPPAGPLELLANDPMTRGPQLFAAHCATCHRFNGHDGLENVLSEPATSSDLAGFASRAWVRGLLAHPMDPRYFGSMVTPEGEPAHTRMSNWVAGMLERNEAETERATLLENFDAAAAYLEYESIRPGALATITPEETEAEDMGAAFQPVPDRLESPSHGPNLEVDELVLRGRRFFMVVCNECHRYAGSFTGTRKAPEMLGYGSVAWIERMIADPSHDTLYRSVGRQRARMPAFEDRLSERDRRVIAEWLHSNRELGRITR